MTREEYLEHYSEKRAAESYQKGRAEGVTEGYQKGRDEVIANLIRGTESPDAEIARLIGVPEQEVREIRERISRQ